MNLTDVENVTIDFANCIFGNINTKQKAKDKLFKFILLTCQQYNQDENFKREINTYIEYQKANWFKR